MTVCIEDLGSTRLRGRVKRFHAVWWLRPYMKYSYMYNNNKQQTAYLDRPCMAGKVPRVCITNVVDLLQWCMVCSCVLFRILYRRYNLVLERVAFDGDGWFCLLPQLDHPPDSPTIRPAAQPSIHPNHPSIHPAIHLSVRLPDCQLSIRFNIQHRIVNFFSLQ